MIQFKCWYCGRRYAKADKKIGERLTCACKYELRVPKKSGGNCRVRSIVDWLMQAIVCGGGGALLGFGLALLVVSRIRVYSAGLLTVLPVIGFLAGLFGGERGLDWLGGLIRDREND